MDLTLTRFRADAQGVFSYLTEPAGGQIAVTGTHAYLQADGVTYAPVTGPGVYICRRGWHRILNPTANDPQNMTTFETFEITGVEGHSGVLFHWGNLPETQSEGCELLGDSFGSINTYEAVLHSVDTFRKFMELQSGVDTFQLTVQ